MHLKKEKQEIEEAMKKQEEESKRKELEFRREMDRIAAEKKHQKKLYSLRNKRVKNKQLGDKMNLKDWKKSVNTP